MKGQTTGFNCLLLKLSLCRTISHYRHLQWAGGGDKGLSFVQELFHPYGSLRFLLCFAFLKWFVCAVCSRKQWLGAGRGRGREDAVYFSRKSAFAFAKRSSLFPCFLPREINTQISQDPWSQVEIGENEGGEGMSPQPVGRHTSGAGVSDGDREEIFQLCSNC